MRNFKQDYCFLMNYKKIFLIILTEITIFSCSPALYLPSINDSEQSGISQNSLKIGRTLYINNCSSCHNLHLPQQYTKQNWDTILIKMKLKANIDERKLNLIKNYLLVKSKK